MSWATLSDEQVLKEFTPQETSAIQAVQGATTQLAGIRGDVVNAWRGAISASGQTVSTTASTIPDQIRPYVIAQIRWNWLISLPALKALQTDARKAAATRAEEKLEKIEAGDLRVETPDGTVATASPSITQRTRGFERGRTNADGTTQSDDFDGM